MHPESDPPRHGRVASLARALVAAIPLLASACGGDDCAGVLTFNVSAGECESLAEQFGCSGFDVEGPRCGLYGCASCGDLDDEDDGG